MRIPESGRAYIIGRKIKGAFSGIYCLINTKDKHNVAYEECKTLQKATAAMDLLQYAAVCYFHRQARNYLESGEVRGNMRIKFIPLTFS